MSSKLKIKLLETQSYRNVLIFGQGKSVMLGQGPEWENLGWNTRWRYLNVCLRGCWLCRIPWTLKACRDSPLFHRKKLALLSCLQKLQKCLPHEALATPSGVALPPLLAVRQATEVKSQHNYAGDMLDLIGKERDDTLKLLQELASMYYKEPGDYT